MIVTIDDGNENNNKTISKKDTVCYFICGIFGDALPGFFFSSTILLALDIPDGKPALLSLCSDVGGVLGIIIATWIIVKLNPQARVVFNGTTQAIGILFTWFLHYPANLIAGITLLTIGFQGMLATVMPLSTYAGKKATKSYQVGFAGAPIFGVAIVKICDAAGFDKNGFFGVALAMPILNMISFFCLDHSVWKVVDEDDVGVGIDDVNTNDNCVDLEGDGTTKKLANEEEESNESSMANAPTKSNEDEKSNDNITSNTPTKSNEEEKSNDNSTSNAPTKSDQIDETTKDINKFGEGSDEIRSVDLRQIEHDFKKPKQQQHSKKSFAKTIRETLGSEMKPMTRNDYMVASKEMLKYWALYMVNFMSAQFFQSAMYQPTLVESSASYHGIEGGAGSKTSDTILLVNHIGVFLVGLTISTPLGTILPKISPYYLWIPAIGTVVLNVIAIIGVAYGAFPPMPVWAVYILSTMIWVLFFFVYLYTPLFVMHDKDLTSRYGEFHQQSLFLVVSVAYLLMDILCVVWFGNSILDKCKSVYEGVYENTSCSWETDAI